MDRIECLSAFVHVLESGSFSAAARRLGTTQPTISKRIAILEEQFDTSLFLRSTRRLAPTVEGERVYEKALAVLEAYDLMRASAQGVSPQPTGTLTLSLPSSLGRNLLMPLIAKFRRQYPEVSLDIRLSERQVNLIEEGAELALRIGDLADSSIRARLLSRIPRFAVASPKYLHERPAPRDPTELQHHMCIGYSRFGKARQWVFEGEHGRHVAQVDCELNLDDADAMQASVTEGLGIAILPIWLVSPLVEKGELEIVLPEYTIPSLPLHAVYPEPRSLSLRARRFLDFLVEHITAFMV